MPPRKVPEFQTQHMPNRDLRLYDCLQKTLQELRILSSVTLNCQVAKIVMDSGSQLSEL